MQIEYKVSPSVRNDDLIALFAEAWPDRRADSDLTRVLQRSLAYVCAYRGHELVGFVNVAWDGGAHAFVLDTTVRSDMRRQGIGRELMRRAVEAARAADCDWLHVDYEARLAEFHRKCGFSPTAAGLINLRQEDRRRTSASIGPAPAGC